MPDFQLDDHDDDLELDDTHLYCPACGCAAEVLRMPRPRSETWFNSAGLAECFHCHARFDIEVVESPPDPPRQPSPWEWLIEAIARAKDELLK